MRPKSFRARAHQANSEFLHLYIHLLQSIFQF